MSKLFGTTALVALALLVASQTRPLFAGQSAAKTFASAEQASNVLFHAAENGNEQELQTILGAGKDVTSSGDEVEDKLEREQFTKKYQEMHRLVQEADGSMILYIGAENWPFPIPLVSRNGAWRFDSDAGRQEIKFRTVGENESTAVEVCDAFAAATKRDTKSNSSDDSVSAYGQKLASFWATDSADLAKQNDPPFHGYYFRTEKITGRIALVAYPAKYQSSGVMTFLVKEDGVVYEKDLGPKATALAPSIKLRKVDSSWQPAQ
jgi:hypothetical protein